MELLRARVRDDNLSLKTGGCDQREGGWLDADLGNDAADQLERCLMLRPATPIAHADGPAVQSRGLGKRVDFNLHGPLFAWL
jgi:hypothetical protein